ncbi:PEP-CTERM sorting domain-containing protein [Tsuneonella deserti]|uniref:PEP-CTERM sorting domain-containing protein n=1 Tax=Tsuneonella deserti TaxID=2035528 RepID=UPI001E2CD28F|nr:PEP-CTERM sorting domain-containing protein [Tsuneonella deserti]
MKFAISLMLLGFATPALAAGAAVPEPSAMALFGLGVLGVIVGRRSARGKRD